MKKLISFIFFCLLSVNAYCQTNLNLPENLFLKGDVRTKTKSEWGANNTHSFKAEANLGCDYNLPDAWVSVKMKASTSNGKESVILLDKAFLGYQLYDGDKGAVALEVGRNKMDSMYTSKLQYDSYFNGLHVVYNYTQPGMFNFMLHGGPHVVNSDRNHYGWLAEAEWSHIADFPLTLTYSFTDWNAPKMPKGSDSYRDKNYLYCISQMTASYQIYNTTLYGAYLLNHQEDHYNDGFYLGFTTGKIQDKGDFEVDVNFQSCKANAVSPVDFKGLKKGVQVKATYALAQALNIEGKFTIFDDHNGSNNNRRLEFAAIYAW